MQEVIQSLICGQAGATDGREEKGKEETVQGK